MIESCCVIFTSPASVLPNYVDCISGWICARCISWISGHGRIRFFVFEAGCISSRDRRSDLRTVPRTGSSPTSIRELIVADILAHSGHRTFWDILDTHHIHPFTGVLDTHHPYSLRTAMQIREVLSGGRCSGHPPYLPSTSYLHF